MKVILLRYPRRLSLEANIIKLHRQKAGWCHDKHLSRLAPKNRIQHRVLFKERQKLMIQGMQKVLRSQLKPRMRSSKGKKDGIRKGVCDFKAFQQLVTKLLKKSSYVVPDVLT